MLSSVQRWTSVGSWWRRCTVWARNTSSVKGRRYRSSTSVVVQSCRLSSLRETSETRKDSRGGPLYAHRPGRKLDAVRGRIVFCTALSLALAGGARSEVNIQLRGATVDIRARHVPLQQILD